MVRAASCGLVLSWRNDTDVCALFLLFLMAVLTGPSKMVAITFPAENVVFACLGFGNPGRSHSIEGLLSGMKYCTHVSSVVTIESKQSPLPACTVTTMTAPLAAVYSCVRLSINTGSIGRTLSSTEGVV